MQLITQEKQNVKTKENISLNITTNSYTVLDSLQCTGTVGSAWGSDTRSVKLNTTTIRVH